MNTRAAARLDRSLMVGMAWTGGVKWGSSLVTLGLTVVTARLLSPADYGVMGVAVVCIGLAQLVSDVGLNATIIRAPELSEDLAARLGGAAVMLATAVASITLGLAPVFAVFFREPRVRAVITVLSVSFVLRGVQVLRRGLLARALQFKQLALIDAGEAVVSASTALVFASLGARYWSLVIGLIAGGAVSTIACVMLYPHRMAFPRTLSQLDGSLTFGTQVLGGQLAWYAYTSADVVIVGRVLGTAALGAYTFAWVIAGFAVERIAALAGKVTPAVFAAVQYDHPALRRYVYALTEGLALVTLPACIGIALTADLIVAVVLGPAWTAAIAPMRILALYAAVRCVALLFPQVLVYTGKARQSMQYNLLALVILVPLFILGASLGKTSGVAWVWVLAFPALTGATYFNHLRRTIGLSTRAYLRALRPALLSTAVMAAVVLGARAGSPADGSRTVELAAAVLLGAASYAVVVYLRYRDRLLQLWNLIRGRAEEASPQQSTAETEVKPPENPARGRILLICYHYPPDPAIGSLRWQKFTRYAVERGWGVDVIMRDERSITNPDPERLRDLPENVCRYGVAERTMWFSGLEQRAAAFYRRFVPRTVAIESLNIAEVTTVRSSRDLARAYFALVAFWRMRRWAADAAARAQGVIDHRHHRVIIACGPPFSVCVAGRLLARRTKLPLVLDLRDPWGAPQRISESVASPVALALNAREEARAVSAAHLVVANSAPVGDDMRARYPQATIIDIPNGYDAEALPIPEPRRRFLIAYAGTIYLDRDPSTLFAALRQVVESQGLTPADIGIALMGTVERNEGGTLEQRAQDAGVAAYVDVYPTRTRSQALAFLAEASMLVLLSQDADKVIPGKLYEYMGFEAWILALAEPWSATARILEGSAADVVSGADSAAIAQVIRRRHEEHLRGVRATPVAKDIRFSRAARAEAFFGALDSILQESHTAPEHVSKLRQPMVSAR